MSTPDEAALEAEARAALAAADRVFSGQAEGGFARKPDVARLPSDPDVKLHDWEIEYLDGKKEHLSGLRLISTDSAFVKLRRADTRLVLLACAALRSIVQVDPLAQP